jgi:hypothetical protein
MTVLEQKTAYIAELAKAKRFLPGHYLAKVKELLPDKSDNRIKNACSGLVRDAEVLKAVQKIAEKERKRREQAARKELRATQIFA